MKIRSLAINQFKKFTTPTSLNDIGDGLNVVVGPNEMGKSTLLDALRAVLFEKHSSKAQSITALQNDRNQAAPVVELAFEVDEGVYRIRKRFLKKPYAHLFCPDGRKLEGDESEDVLRDLLGFDEPGKSGTKAEALGMWNVLWVQQGQSFGSLELPDSARSNLHSALESEVGAVLGGKRGRALLGVVEKLLSELVTSTNRPRGDYKELIEEAEKIQSELDELRIRRQGLSEVLGNLETAQETLIRLSSREGDHSDNEELDTARKRHAELAKLQTLIDAGATDVELKKRNLEQAKQALAERRSLKDQIETDTETAELAKKNLDEVREQEKELRSKLEQLRKNVKETENAVTQADESVSLLRRVLNAVQRNARIRELQGRYEKAHEAEKNQRVALQSAAAVLVNEENIETIRNAAKALESVRSRLSAAATLVTFEMPSDRLSKIEVDGVALSADYTEVRAIEATAIVIPDYGSISVQPAIKNRDKLLAQQREANDALKSELEKCGVNSLDTAEEQLAKREKLLRDAEFARQEAELHAPSSEDYDAGAEPLANHIEGLKMFLERELSELGVQDLPTEKDAEEALLDAQNSAQDAREMLAAAGASFTGLANEHGYTQAELGAVKTRYEDGKVLLDKLKNDLIDAEQQGSEDDLSAAVSAAEIALVDQEKVVSDLKAQCEGETLQQLEARVDRLEKAVKDRREKRSDLNEKIAGFRAHIEALEGAGLDEAIQQKAREFELTEDRLQRYEREVQVLSLLLSHLALPRTPLKSAIFLRF